MSEMQIPRFEDKVAIITGSGRGIGAAIAWQLGKEGASVYIAEMSEELGQQTANTMRTEGIQAAFVQTDVSNPESVGDMVDAVVAEASGVDVLINNAGITRDKSFLGMSSENWRAVIDVHLNGTFFTSQAVARKMVEFKTGGSIVNASSISASFGNKGQANYTAGKGGIDALTLTMAKELSSKNIRVNAVRPGMVDTEMVAGMTDEAKAEIAKIIPLGRLALPEEIARAYCFLASDEASYITGTILNVAGGLVIS